MGPAALKAFRPVSKTTVVDQVIGQIKEFLRHGERGAKLPSERELAKRLGVSRPSIREALRTLGRMGVLDTRHGSGSQVAASSEGLLKAPLEFLLMLDRPSIAELHETRQLLEVHLAGRAALHRTASDLQAIAAPLAELKAGMDRRTGFLDPDARFHAALAAAAHHRLLERIMTCLHDQIVLLMDTVQPNVHDHRASYEIHERIYRAIERRNASQARRLMASHHDMMTDELRKARLLR